jgi:hypothetical protein
MKLKDLKNSWINLTSKANKYGIPLPTVRDPVTGKGSISLTLVFISFNIVIAGLIGKWANIFGGIDIAQALNLFYACAALYWGRKFQSENSSIGETESKPTSGPTEERQKVDSPE